MEIKHDLGKRTVSIDTTKGSAYVKYVSDGHTLDIRHTFVSPELEGRGIASQLVQYAYDYALEKGLKLKATCPYAAAWLERHPGYKND